jgi:hypothetical protein
MAHTPATDDSVRQANPVALESTPVFQRALGIFRVIRSNPIKFLHFSFVPKGPEMVIISD